MEFSNARFECGLAMVPADVELAKNIFAIDGVDTVGNPDSAAG